MKNGELVKWSCMLDLNVPALIQGKENQTRGPYIVTTDNNTILSFYINKKPFLVTPKSTYFKMEKCISFIGYIYFTIFKSYTL